MVLAVVRHRRWARRAKSSGGPDWTRVIIGLAVTAVALAAIVSVVDQLRPASASFRRSVDRTYAVLAAPLAAQSQQLSATLRTVRTSGPTLARVTFFRDLDGLASDAAALATHFDTLTAQPPSGHAGSQCSAAMHQRERAASTIRTVLEGLIGGRTGERVTDQADAPGSLVSAGALLQTADTSWSTCRLMLLEAPGSARLPQSVWVTDPTFWGVAALQSFVRAVAGSRSLAVNHSLTILSVTTDPPAVVSSGTSVSLARLVHIRVVISDRGDVDERAVHVQATAQSLTPVPQPAAVRATVSLGAGSTAAVGLPVLKLTPGASYIVQVSVNTSSGLGGAGRSWAMQVASTPSPSTTTTAPRPPTTTSTTAPKPTPTTANSHSTTTTTAPKPTTTAPKAPSTTAHR
jgi:hypothetical protein